MNFKSLFLVVVFALFIGVNNTSAQCECLDAIDAAIFAVENPAFDECEFVDDYDWKVPPSLRKNLAKARRSCKNNPPAVENILRGMIETIDETLLGGESEHPWKTVLIEFIEFPLVVYNPPAPCWVEDELVALRTLLEGCGAKPVDVE